MFKNLKIAIIDEQHLTAVCEVLESMGYHKQKGTGLLGRDFVATDKNDGAYYIFRNGCFLEEQEPVTLRDLLQMRNEMVKEKINGFN